MAIVRLTKGPVFDDYVDYGKSKIHVDGDGNTDVPLFMVPEMVEKHSFTPPAWLNVAAIDVRAELGAAHESELPYFLRANGDFSLPDGGEREKAIALFDRKAERAAR